jgi:ABC-type proline/glycine betaine transport system substrate-binding protein
MSGLKTRMGVLTLLAAMLLPMALAACGEELFETRFSGGPEDLDPNRKGTVIKLATTRDQYSSTFNAIMVYVIEKGYGYTPQVMTVTEAELAEALKNGTVDIALAARQPSSAEWFDSAAASGEILALGPTYEFDGHVYTSAATPGLATTAPDLVEFLQQAAFKQRRVKETHDWYTANPDKGLTRLAVYYLWNYNYEDDWKHWMPYDPAERIRSALEVFTGLPSGDPYRGVETDRSELTGKPAGQ